VTAGSRVQVAFTEFIGFSSFVLLIGVSIVMPGVTWKVDFTEIIGLSSFVLLGPFLVMPSRCRGFHVFAMRKFFEWLCAAIRWVFSAGFVRANRPVHLSLDRGRCHRGSGARTDCRKQKRRTRARIVHGRFTPRHDGRMWALFVIYPYQGFGGQQSIKLLLLTPRFASADLLRPSPLDEAARSRCTR
jgi:hypothetical protein